MKDNWHNITEYDQPSVEIRTKRQRVQQEDVKHHVVTKQQVQLKQKSLKNMLMEEYTPELPATQSQALRQHKLQHSQRVIHEQEELASQQQRQ